MSLTATLSAAFALTSGDTVVFYGDSITQQQLYTVYIEAFTYTRYPALQVRFYNRGWSGDTSWSSGGGTPYERVERDVKPLKPSVVTVMLGMNDGGYSPYDQKTFTTFQDSYSALLGYIRTDAPRTRLTLIRTSPWDDFAHIHEPYAPGPWRPWQGYNETLLRYGQVVQDLAAKENDLYVDFNKPVADMLVAAEKANPQLAPQIISDSIHPGPAGHLIMAGELLKAWGATSLVTDVRLDAAADRVLSSSNAKVENFDGLAWTERDGSLPFCVDPEDKLIQLALSSSKFTSQLNEEKLRVQNLPTAQYELVIDGSSVGKFSSEQLGQGINLALYSTPMRKQAAQVLDLAERRSKTDFTKWRDVEIDDVGLHSAPEAAQALDKLETELYSAERLAAQPRPHKYELRIAQPKPGSGKRRS